MKNIHEVVRLLLYKKKFCLYNKKIKKIFFKTKRVKLSKNKNRNLKKSKNQNIKTQSEYKVNPSRIKKWTLTNSYSNRYKNTIYNNYSLI